MAKDKIVGTPAEVAAAKAVESYSKEVSAECGAD